MLNLFLENMQSLSVSWLVQWNLEFEIKKLNLQFFIHCPQEKSA